MKVAVLPFNAAEGTPPALGRQFSNFACDTIRAATQADINPVSFLAQIEGDDGPRAAYVNIADSLLDQQWISEMFQQSQVDVIMDGLLKKDGENFDLTVRFHRNGQAEPAETHEHKFTSADLFKHLHGLVKDLARNSDVQLPDALMGETLDFGTDSPEAFLLFLEGYDGVLYIQQANGQVAREFVPKNAMDALLSSLELDKDFIAPYETLVQLCRLCGQYRLGSFDDCIQSLKRLAELVPEDYKAHFAMGELFQSVNDPISAANAYEKAVQLEPNEAALLTRLGIAQLAQNMPVNAERNFRRAIELEGDDKPSMDYLAAVLQQTNRSHEIPPLWKDMVEKYPANPQMRAKYAISLIQAGQDDAGIQAFEEGLNAVEDQLIIKRYYAPLLVQKGDLDRAMDFYEDCLDAAPNDVQLLLEYADALQKAERQFEVPRVLRDVLSANPDPNTRAQTLAWLIEIEQPRRVEVVEKAREKMQAQDFVGAINDLKPLKNWLNDYWKLWAILATSFNAVGEAEEAEDAAKRLVDLFPGLEGAYEELNRALSAQGKHEEAYHMMRYAFEMNQQSLQLFINLALATKRVGRDDEAAAMAKQIREVVGPNPDLEKVLAEIDR
jgi:tetratricopeptide (TPR) repeat protein